MAISKVVLNGRTLIDFTSDTVTPDTLEADYTATDASGQQITGTYTGPSGTITITENAENIDVTQYAFANVEVASAMGATENWYLLGSFPSVYENSSITSIGMRAFWNNQAIEELSLSNCTRIGASAFASCSNLQSIYAPMLDLVDTTAFIHCINLSQISFPSLYTISSGAFSNCKKLESVYIPVCTTISTNAFRSCAKLTSLYALNCKSIGTAAFGDCFGLETVSFPSCSSIANGAFSSCTKLQYISLPECTNIGLSAFSGCYSLSYAYIPKASSINTQTFVNCSSLLSIYAPQVRAIYSSGFAYCRNLPSIYLQSACILYPNAFYTCSNMSIAIFGGGQTVSSGYLSGAVFNACHKLISLYFLQSFVMRLSISGAFASTPIAGYTEYTDGVYGSIYVPESLYSAYISSTNWTIFSERLVSISPSEIETLLGGL